MKRYIYYRYGTWYEFKNIKRDLGEQITPQGELGDEVTPQDGDCYIQSIDARGRSPLPPLPDGFYWEGPYGLGDDHWVLRQRQDD